MRREPDYYDDHEEEVDDESDEQELVAFEHREAESINRSCA